MTYSKSPKSKHIKAHVNYSNGGICEKSLLAACLDAYIDGKDESYANEVLQGFPKYIFGTLNKNKNKSMMVTVVKQKSSEGLCVICNQLLTTKNSLPPAHVERRKQSVIIDVLKKLTFDYTNSEIVMWEALPDWVTEQIKRLITEILNASEKTNNEDNKDLYEESDDDFRRKYTEMVYLQLFFAISTLLCLDLMGVREVSHPPLPIFTGLSPIADIKKELYRGMEILPSETSVMSTVFGIALLRILQCKVTPFVFQKSGCGADEENDHSVSIVVGYYNNDFGISDHNNTGTNSLFRSDHVTHLETNLDDISGENLAFAIQMLLDNRALDAWVTPIVMKKGRPAYTLHCLCKDGGIDDEDNVNMLLELIFTHTLTLGVRIYRNVPRAKLDRFITTVETSYTNTSRKGLVDIKVSRFNNGKVVRKKAEFDHCKVISTEVRGVGISTVAEQAVMAYDKANNAQSTMSNNG